MITIEHGVFRTLCAATMLAGALLSGGAASADEQHQIRIAKQYGISYLPLEVMEARHLIETRAKAAGLGDVKVEWSQLSSGAPMNDALLSGNLDVVSGGVGPMLTIWAKTKGNYNVKAVASINSMPLYLNTVNPKVTTLKDFTAADRIALPAVKVSIQAVTLAMAAEQQLGKADALDSLEVSMAHPDGMAAMMSGKSEITAHFTSAPFMYQELEDKRVRRVLNSYDVLGGHSTFNLVWTTSKFHDQNPKLYGAFFAALDDAMGFINGDKKAAAELWIAAEHSKLALPFVQRILDDPENVYTTVPQNVMKYATFMHKTGAIREMPAAWTDVFFPEIKGKAGS
ncbi:MAG TPA: ABC transporter substrate-binding protein [Alphaproteobacteria bacterium]|nr:ABC transporter substrate-binding protein [Alphaproteobacteria bacterium]